MRAYLDFANALAGSLGFLTWLVCMVRAVQIAFAPAGGDQTRVIQPAAGDTDVQEKGRRLTMVLAVGFFLFFEWVADFRDVYGRHIMEWDSTVALATAAWLGKSAMACFIVREISLKQCGEKAWVIFLCVSTVIAIAIR